MAALPVLYGESTFLRVVPTTVTDGKISALGTKIDFVRIVNVKPGFASANATAGDTYFTTEGSNNNRYSRPDNSKNYNILSGEVIAEDSGNDAQDKFDCEIFVSPAQRKTLIEAYKAGTPVFGIRDIGKAATTAACAGYEYILGKITDLVDGPERSASKLSFSITGNSSLLITETVPGTPDVEFADFNTAATGSGNKITPDNESELTITAIDSTDWTSIIVGKIVTKNV
jgi:hypothetical protein